MTVRTPSEIRDILGAGGIPLFSDEHAIFHFSDKDYGRTTKQWITKDYADWWYDKFLAEHGLNLWAKTFDCDNFANLFHSYAQLAHGLRMQQLMIQSPPEGVTAGWFCYVQESGRKHRAIVAIVEDDDLIFIDPTPGKSRNLTLTSDERKSIYRGEF